MASGYAITLFAKQNVYKASWKNLEGLTVYTFVYPTPTLQPCSQCALLSSNYT